jgi:hypothetical protein
MEAVRAVVGGVKSRVVWKMKFICPDTQSFDVLECSNIVVRVASVVGISCCETAKVAGNRVSETIMNLKRRTRHLLPGRHSGTAVVHYPDGDLWTVEARRFDQMVGLDSLARVDVLPRRSEWPTWMSGGC